MRLPTVGMPRGKKPAVARAEVRNWSSDNIDDEQQVSAAKLLSAGGTWRSYAYNCGQLAPEHTERNQLLISKNGGSRCNLWMNTISTLPIARR